MLTVDILDADATVHTKDLDGDGKRFDATSDDPQMVFDLATPLKRGWCHCRFEIAGTTISRPYLYLDLGHGFTELHTLVLLPDEEEDGVFVGDFFAPGPVARLRLDPTDRRSDISFGSLSIKMTGTRTLDRLTDQMRRGAHLGRQAFGVLRRNPGRIVTNWRQYVAYARGPAGLGRITPEGFLASSEERSHVSYRDWIKRNDFDLARDREAVEAAVAALTEPPLISVVMPVYNTPGALLDAAIESVREQIYPHWELCIADDASTNADVRERLEKWQGLDPRIKLAFRPENGHICHATNSAFELATSDWIALLDHDDVLRPHALAEVALEIARAPGAELIYSDEDKIDESGKRFDPFFKPDFSRELFRSQNYLNHLTVHRAQNIRAVGGWRPGLEGSQDYDLSLRIFEIIPPGSIRHIPKILYHWRAVAGSTARGGEEKNYALDAGLAALREHVDRSGLKADVSVIPGLPYYRLRPEIAEPAPLVSIVIPTRDRVSLLRACIDSIRKNTVYPGAYEILVVDNGSVEAETLAYFDDLRSSGTARIVAYEKPFNYSAINNFAVAEAKGSVLALVNNDIVVISPDWLAEMVSWAMLPDVGCVGAKLYYGNETVQHAGVILGIGGVAGHSHKYYPRDHPGYFSRLKVVQNLSAVTAACLVVRRDVYEEVGGLDEARLAVAFNDVDFCLKVREAGYANVFTPFAELYHLESISRGVEDSLEKQERFAGEVMTMKERWGDALLRDPFYSPSLTLRNEDFSMR